MGQKNSNLSEFELSNLSEFELSDLSSAHSKFEDGIENINQMLSRLEVKTELLLCKQTLTNIGFWYISRFAQEGGFDPTLASNDGLDPKLLEDVAAKLLNQPETTFKDNSPQNSNCSHNRSEVVEMIIRRITGFKRKMDLFESKQVILNQGVWYLNQFFESCKDGFDLKRSFKDGLDTKYLKALGNILLNQEATEYEDNSSEIGQKMANYSDNDVEMLQQSLSVLEEKMEVILFKKDSTNTGIWCILQFTKGFKEMVDPKILEVVTKKLIPEHMARLYKKKSLEVNSRKMDKVNSNFPR